VLDQSRPRIAVNVESSQWEIDAMPRAVPLILSSLIACAFTGLVVVQAKSQQQSAPASPAGSQGPATGGGRDVKAGDDEVLATITAGNATEKVTKGEVRTFTSRYTFGPDDTPDSIYRITLDTLINTKLLSMFLARQPITVTPDKVDEQIEQLKQQLKSEGQDLPTAILQNKISMDDIRKEYESRLRWDQYWKSRATEATLRKYADDNRDLFSGTQWRASHILIKVDPDASEAEKQKAKQKLANIKKEIEAGTITFAAAANKYSEDPANSGGAGGDLDYFTLGTGLVEEFTNVAFRLKKGTISDPVETPFGFHLIQVTDRKEGKPVDFEQNKPYIMREYATVLQKNVVMAERKAAKTDIKPMPKDLFPTQAAPAAPAATATGSGGEKVSTKGTETSTPK
jgi:peptidyl-prolyl cis-trans isomerase C